MEEIEEGGIEKQPIQEERGNDDDCLDEQDMGGHDEIIRDSDQEDMAINGEDRDGDSDIVTERLESGITDITIDAAVDVPLGGVLDRLMGQGLSWLPKSMGLWE
jgi:hypothetical protein